LGAARDGAAIRPAWDRFTIELVGEIATTPQISAGSGTFTIEPYASSVKVVAGDRYHRESLILRAEV